MSGWRCDDYGEDYAATPDAFLDLVELHRCIYYGFDIPEYEGSTLVIIACTPMSDSERYTAKHIEQNSSDKAKESHYDELDIDPRDVRVVKKQQEVFAKVEDGPQFRGLSCLGAAVLIIKTQIGLGVLGLPLTLKVMGFVPGLISLVLLCALCLWTGLLVGKFRLKHPNVHSIGDASYLLFGRAGLEIMGSVSWLFYTLAYGAGILTVSDGFDLITDHATCKMVWVGVGAAVSLLFGCGIRTLRVLSWLGYVAVASVFFAIWIVCIAVLTQPVPATAPTGKPIHKDIYGVPHNTPYYAISSAIGTQVFSLAGTASFFTIHAEMADQRKYAKSLYLGQGFVIFNYILVACILYAKVGQYVGSPALDSAGPLVGKIAYGIGLPAMFFASFWQAHIAGKYALVRLLRGTKHLQSNSVIHWLTWITMMVIVIIVGFVVASSIPIFGDLLGLIGSLLGTSFMLVVPGFMALYMVVEEANPDGLGSNLAWLKQSLRCWSSSKSDLLIFLTAWFSIIGGLYATVTGVYGAVMSIIQAYESGTVRRAFPCN